MLTRGRGMAPTLRSLAATAAVLGTAAMLAQLALADPLARFALHDSRAELGLCTLAPACRLLRRRGAAGVLFGAAKGGTEYHCPTGGADRADGRGRIGAGKAGPLGRGLRLLCGAHRQYCQRGGLLRHYGAVCPAGTELPPCADDPPRGYTSRELWEIVLPVTGSRLVASVLQAGESVLIPACLAAYLGTRAEAVAQYGSLKGMALPLIFFPFSVLAALSGLLMPEITRAHTARDTAALRRLVRLAMGLTGGFSLLVGAALVLFGKDAAILLYHDAQAATMCRYWALWRPLCTWKAWWMRS